MEKIITENRIGYAQRGDYACLAQRAGSTARRGIEVEPRLLDLSKHHAREATINHHTFLASAMRKHMMT